MSQADQKATHERTREDFLALTDGDILDLRGKDLDAACARLCMQDVEYLAEYDSWTVVDEGRHWWFEPSTRLTSAAFAYESMAKRGWEHCDINLGSGGAFCRMYALMGMQSIQSESKNVCCSGKTEAEARTMACVLAAWKDGQYEK